MKPRRALREGQLGQIFRILSPRDRRRTFVVLGIQILFGFLDLLGVAFVGILGALTVSGIQSGVPGNKVSTALRLMHLDGMSFQQEVTWLGILASSFLIGRTLLSVFLTRRTMSFLANRGAHISTELVSKFLAKPMLSVQRNNSFQSMYALTNGVWIAILEVLGTTILMISDFSLLIIIGIGLFFLDPSLALITISTFLIVGYCMYRGMRGKARFLGEEKTRLEILTNQKISEVIGSYRESVVRGRRFYYAQEIGKLRFASAKVEAESTFMPYVSKYVIEITFIIGALAISAIQFLLTDAVHAIATLSVFLAAGSRIAPAVLRLQQGAIIVRSGLGRSSSTIAMIQELKNIEVLKATISPTNFSHLGFKGSIYLKDVYFAYPGQKKLAIEIPELRIDAGSSLAIVGPSGAGKTTLVDVLLGILPTSNGIVLLGGMPPSEVIDKWPGAISYVPQDIAITNGTIRENIALGFNKDQLDDQTILNALKLAKLEDFISSLPLGLDTCLGERGGNISGGQRQRIGIARALVTNPRILVLDEATSSLDGETESEISAAISNLKGKTTVVIIAHRLASVRNSDSVLYLESGRAIMQGTFTEVRNAVPNFERQALLMGL